MCTQRLVLHGGELTSAELFRKELCGSSGVSQWLRPVITFLPLLFIEVIQYQRGERRGLECLCRKALFFLSGSHFEGFVCTCHLS